MEETEERSRKQFDSWSNNYDKNFHFPFYFSNKAIVELIDPQNGASMLDLGCGTGILLQQLHLLNRGLKLYGLDISPEMVKIASSKVPGANIQNGSASKLPYKANLFDYVTCANSFHHYPDSQLTIKEIFRVLKHGGKFVLLDPFVDGLFRKFINRTINILFNEGDTKIYSGEAIKLMFQDAGFKSIRQTTQWYYKLITIAVK